MAASTHPGVIWAQRQRLVFVTIEVSDCVNPEIKVRIEHRTCCSVFKPPVRYFIYVPMAYILHFLDSCWIWYLMQL